MTDVSSPPPAARPEEPVHHSDHPSNRPPRWLWRAMLMGIAAVFLGIGSWYAIGSLQSVFVNLLIALFLALALEPIAVWLVRHGWRRGAAAGAAMFGSLVVVLVIMGLFGNLFIQQLIQLFGAVPSLYQNVTTWLQDRFDVEIPATDQLLNQLLSQWGEDVASGALLVGSTIIGGVFATLTIGLVTFYLLAAGPTFRAAICRYLTPNRQTEVLRMWEITQTKVSEFISSRIVLAAVCTAATAAFLLAFSIPYALPLALFTGLVSQFVPTIGTYIGGALPVIVALTSKNVTMALVVLAFIILYQQVENLWLSPKVSARALEMNPAVSFVVVIAFGAVFGALGAFLALPIAATIQAVANTYMRRHELVSSHMLADPTPERGANRKDGDGDGDGRDGGSGSGSGSGSGG